MLFTAKLHPLEAFVICFLPKHVWSLSSSSRFTGKSISVTYYQPSRVDESTIVSHVPTSTNATYFTTLIVATTSASSETTATTPSASLISSTSVTTGSDNPSTTATSSTVTTQPSPVPQNSTVPDDIEIIHVRRLSFIIAAVWTQGALQNGCRHWARTENGLAQKLIIQLDAQPNVQTGPLRSIASAFLLETLSAAYHGGLPNASQYVGDQNLRASITLAMDWWFSNDYTNVACRDQGGSASCPCGTPGLWNTNWFPNVIGVPGNMMRSCLLLNDTLTATQLSNCTNFGSRAYGTFGRVVNGLGFLTGANTLDVASIGIDLGLLTGNVSLIDNAYRRVHNEVVVQQAVKADGIRPDGSFGQHAGVIYNGNYGEDYTDDVLALELEAAGTQYEATGTSKNEFATLIDGDQWMIYRNVLTGVLHWDLSVAGRFISAPVADGAAIASVHLNLTDIRQLGTQWGSDTLTEVAERLSRDSTTANAGSLDGNRVFYNNDYMVQRGRKYVKTLRTYSNRTLNTECVNTQNPFGFHLSDGTVYTYLKGNEYEDIFAAWDWNLIPGITVDYNVTTLNCQTTLWTGLESFVGGVSDSRIGVGAVRYTNPFTRSLSWKKVWFFLENDVQHVMINSISSTTNASIFSVLDQRRHEGEIRVNGQYVTSGNYTIVGSLWHANVGYKFSTDGEDACDTWSDGELQLSISVGNRTGNWSSLGVSRQPPTSVDLFAAWLYHKDLSQSVSYTVFPGLPYGEFLDRAQSTDLEDVQNDGNVSAVWDATHRTIGIVFWNDGGGEITFPDVLHTTSLSVKADRGLAVIIAMKSRTITVADPSQTSIDAQVDLTWGDGPESLRWGTSRVKVFTFLLPTGGSAGKSVTIDMW